MCFQQFLKNGYWFCRLNQSREFVPFFCCCHCESTIPRFTTGSGTRQTKGVCTRSEITSKRNIQLEAIINVCWRLIMKWLWNAIQRFTIWWTATNVNYEKYVNSAKCCDLTGPLTCKSMLTEQNWHVFILLIWWTQDSMWKYESYGHFRGRCIPVSFVNQISTAEVIDRWCHKRHLGLDFLFWWAYQSNLTENGQNINLKYIYGTYLRTLFDT